MLKTAQNLKRDKLIKPTELVNSYYIGQRVKTISGAATIMGLQHSKAAGATAVIVQNIFGEIGWASPKDIEVIE
ncbi:MAG: hypothetical protein K940chlam2_01689 [Chlamydiae bacterium]|nr:hypothetical protein [Chlamydiota bacterium]